MPINLVRRGGNILRKLPVQGAFARPIRVVTPQNQVRRISFVARQSRPTSITHSVPQSSFIVGNLVRGYAEKGRPKGSTAGKPKKKKQPKKAAKRPGRKKGPMTEEQKEKKKAAAFRKHLRELKENSLKLPKGLPVSSWVVAVTTKSAQVDNEGLTRPEAFKKAIELARSISAEENQRYVDIATANRAANKAAYEAWVQSHTPLQILEANKARRRLGRIKDSKKVTLIKDDRLVKKPLSPFIIFYQEQRDTSRSDVANLTQAAAHEWKNLSESAKEKYREVAKADRQRYEREYLEVYGKPAPEQSQQAEDEE